MGNINFLKRSIFKEKISELKSKKFGNIIVSTAYGGDSFLLCNAKDFNLKIMPDNAFSFVRIARELLKEANEQIGFKHPTMPDLNYISFCQFMEPLEIDSEGQKTAKNTVVIRPGKLDRSPCGTGTSARLALMREKNEIDINEIFISRSIIGSEFICKIENEFVKENIKYINPLITNSDRKNLKIKTNLTINLNVINIIINQLVVVILLY